MKQLSGLDATFLHLETSAQFGHVSSLSIYTRPDDPDYRPYDAWRAQLQQRLHLLEPLRRRLAEVPLGLDHPYWVEDPAFDLDFHVRHTAVPPPGTEDQLAAIVGRLVSRPLDRRKPLWLSYVIEGLPDRRFAVLTIVHHATIDGASGVELMTLMLDDSPEGGAAPPDDDQWAPERPPGDLEMLARGALGLARKPAAGSCSLPGAPGRSAGRHATPCWSGRRTTCAGACVDRWAPSSTWDVTVPRSPTRHPPCPASGHRARRSTGPSPRTGSWPSGRRRSTWSSR